jgi:hypothetical protein
MVSKLLYLLKHESVMQKEKIVIQKESMPIRCEICHKSDEYDFLLNKCNRCENIDVPEDTNYVVEYTFSFKDYFITSCYHTLKMPVLYFLFGIYILVSFLIWFGDPYPYHFIILKIFYFFLTSVAFVLFLLCVVFLTNFVSIISRKNKTLLTNYKLITTDKSFIEENEYTRTEIKWKTIQDIIKTKNYIFIYTAQHRIIVIPTKHCTDLLVIEKFYRYIRGKFEETQTQ